MLKQNLKYIVIFLLFLKTALIYGNKINTLPGNNEIVESIKTTLIGHKNDTLSKAQAQNIYNEIVKKDPYEFNEAELYYFVSNTLNNFEPTLKKFGSKFKNIEELKAPRLKSHGIQLNVY
ncbi:MAG: hypothetical protein ABIF12_02080 [bacterium]